MAKKNKGNKKRSLQQRLEAERKEFANSGDGLTLAETLAKSEKQRIAKIKDSISQGEITWEKFFEGSVDKFDREFPGALSGASGGINRKQRYAEVFFEKYKMSGFLVENRDGVMFMPLNHRLAREYLLSTVMSGAGEKKPTYGMFLKVVESLIALDYNIVLDLESLAHHLEDADPRCLFATVISVGDKRLLPGYSADDSARELTSHLLGLSVLGDLEITPTYSYAKLFDLAAKSYQKKNPWNAIRSGRDLDKDFFRKNIINFVRHECSNYDWIWRHVEKVCNLIPAIHEVFRLYVNETIENTYPDLDAELEKFYSAKPAKQRKKAKMKKVFAA